MIIALTGLKQSGKSTAANYLVEKYNFTKHNFKDAMIKEIKQYFPDFIKKECELYNCDVDYLFEKKPGHIRELMKNFGTQLRRGENPNYWVWKWAEVLDELANTNLVVDDCRFLNEAEQIKYVEEGIIIKIIRTGQVSTDTHQSETEMSYIEPDYTIEVATGEQNKLYEELDKILHENKTLS